MFALNLIIKIKFKWIRIVNKQGGIKLPTNTKPKIIRRLQASRRILGTCRSTPESTIPELRTRLIS